MCPAPKRRKTPAPTAHKKESPTLWFRALMEEEGFVRKIVEEDSVFKINEILGKLSERERSLALNVLFENLLRFLHPLHGIFSRSIKERSLLFLFLLPKPKENPLFVYRTLLLLTDKRFPFYAQSDVYRFELADQNIWDTFKDSLKETMLFPPPEEWETFFKTIWGVEQADLEPEPFLSFVSEFWNMEKDPEYLDMSLEFLTTLCSLLPEEKAEKIRNYLESPEGVNFWEQLLSSEYFPEKNFTVILSTLTKDSFPATIPLVISLLEARQRIKKFSKAEIETARSMIGKLYYLSPQYFTEEDKLKLEKILSVKLDILRNVFKVFDDISKSLEIDLYYPPEISFYASFLTEHPEFKDMLLDFISLFELSNTVVFPLIDDPENSLLLLQKKDELETARRGWENEKEFNLFLNFIIEEKIIFSYPVKKSSAERIDIWLERVLKAHKTFHTAFVEAYSLIDKASFLEKGNLVGTASRILVKLSQDLQGNIVRIPLENIEKEHYYLLARYTEELSSYLKTEKKIIKVSDRLIEQIKSLLCTFGAQYGMFKLISLVLSSETAPKILQAYFPEEDIPEILKELERLPDLYYLELVLLLYETKIGKKLYEELDPRKFVRLALQLKGGIHSLDILEIRGITLIAQMLWYLDEDIIETMIVCLNAQIPPEVFNLVLTQRPSQIGIFVPAIQELVYGERIIITPEQTQKILRVGLPLVSCVIRWCIKENPEEAKSKTETIKRYAPFFFENEGSRGLDREILEKIREGVEAFRIEVEEGISLEDMLSYLYPGSSRGTINLLPSIRQDTFEDIKELNFPQKGSELSLGKPLDFEDLPPALQEKINEVCKRKPSGSLPQTITMIIRQGGAIKPDLGYDLFGLHLKKKFKGEKAGNKTEIVRYLVSESFEEEFREWIKGILKQNKEEINFSALFTPRRLAQLRKDIVSLKEKKWGEVLGIGETAEIVSSIVLEKVLLKERKGVVSLLRREQRKTKPIALRAYITKNPFAFLAKATAGICTSGDIELYNRKDHFHIVFVREDTQQCVGSVQGYIIDHPQDSSKKALLFRAFNPSATFLYQVDAREITKIMLQSALDLAQANNMEAFIPEQGSGGYALTDRKSIYPILLPLLSEQESIPYAYRVYGQTTISKVYPLRREAVQGF